MAKKSVLKTKPVNKPISKPGGKLSNLATPRGGRR